jgi:organic radical activating enzyme
MSISIETAIRNGLYLPVMEEFYSLQGEGMHTGKPAYFLRVGGCDVGCHFCDVKESWNADRWDPIAVDDVLQRIFSCPSKAVVVTGGEPLLYNMDYLCKEVHRAGGKLYLETSGSEPLSGLWDWICLSPKKNAPPRPELLQAANELKVIISAEEDFQWAEEQACQVQQSCQLYLQPEWSQVNNMMQKMVDWLLLHPQWSMSLQSHKYMRIP